MMIACLEILVNEMNENMKVTIHMYELLFLQSYRHYNTKNLKCVIWWRNYMKCPGFTFNLMNSTFTIVKQSSTLDRNMVIPFYNIPEETSLDAMRILLPYGNIRVKNYNLPIQKRRCCIQVFDNLRWPQYLVHLRLLLNYCI